MSKTYNIATGIPAPVLALVECLNIRLCWSKHALREAINDKYGVLPPSAYPKNFYGRFRLWEVVEIETNCCDRLLKFVIRRPVDETRSLVLVITLDIPTEGFVKTCWTNLNADTHASLDKTKFTKV